MARGYRGEICTLPDYDDMRRTGVRIVPDGLSVAEIAARMNLRPSYVQKMLERTIQKLRVLLEAETTTEGTA